MNYYDDTTLCFIYKNGMVGTLCKTINGRERSSFFESGKAIFCQNAQPRVENKSSHIFQKLQVTYNKIVHTIFWRQYTRSFL